MFIIAAVKIPEDEDIPPEFIHLFQKNISPEKKQKIAKFRQKADFYRSLLGDVLIRAMIAKYTDLHIRDIHFIANAHGKPFLQNDPDISFNLSHSGNWVAVIFGRGRHCLGIDVEKIMPLPIGDMQSCFSEAENEWLSAKTGREQLDYFFRLWTLKESYVKAVGKGLSIPLNTFSMIQVNGDRWASPEAETFYFKTYRLDRGHKLSCCAGRDELPDHIHYVTMSQLYDCLKNKE